MKTLIVDDSEVARKMTIKLLAQIGIADIVEANNGCTALERLSDTPGIGLVLLDRYMPEMDGLEFLQRLKSIPASANLRVSMVTSEDSMEEKFRTIAEYQADYYITKPVTYQKLLGMKAKLIDNVG